MPIAKKELMARLNKSRKEAGMIKKSFWLTPEEYAKVKKIIDEIKAAK